MELKTTELDACGLNRPFRVLGTMSGTSMDALDVVEAEFTCTDGRWKGRTEALHEVPLDASWPERFGALARAAVLDALARAAAVLGALARRRGPRRPRACRRRPTQ